METGLEIAVGLARGGNALHLILDNIRSAFNVGSIFRTADACAAAHVHLCGMTAYPPNPQLLRTSLGAEGSVPWTQYEKTAEAMDALERLGVAVVAVEVAEGGVNFTEYEWPKNVALMFGHERRGIAPEQLARCAGIVKLPMFGEKNTLNVATAAGIVMYEVLRRWGRLGETPPREQHPFLLP